MIEIGAKLGFMPHISKARRRGPCFIDGRRMADEWFKIDWLLEPQKHSDYRVDDDFVYLPVREVKPIEYEGPVYNLETDANTYCAPFVVHNCCSETALFLWGDCEDSSVLTVGGMRALGVKAEDVYEVFGVVRDAATGAVLGGHGWLYARDKSFETDKYVLVESTLDTPPAKYPEVGSTLDDLKKPFTYGSVVYDPEALFNDILYIEVRPISLGRKDTRVKHETIEKAWGIQSKFMKQLRKSKMFKLKRALKLER
jgi:hypothetical protein